MNFLHTFSWVHVVCSACQCLYMSENKWCRVWVELYCMYVCVHAVGIITCEATEIQRAQYKNPDSFWGIILYNAGLYQKAWTAVTRHASPGIAQPNTETYGSNESRKGGVGGVKRVERKEKQERKWWQRRAKSRERSGKRWNGKKKSERGKVKCTEKGRSLTSWTGGHASNREVCFLTVIPLRRLSWKTD